GELRQGDDRNDVGAQIERQILVEIDVAGDGGARRHHDGVPVGLRLYQRVGAEIAAGARLVLDHHRLAGQFAKLFRIPSDQDVGATAGGETALDLDGAIRKIGV